MSAVQLILLSPYRLPTQSTLSLGDDEVSAFLNGHAALWHPAALSLCLPPPRPPAEQPDLFAEGEQPSFEETSYPEGTEAFDDSTDSPTAPATWQPPLIASPYDHEQPQPGYVYAVPESPPPMLPDDWEQRVREAGAVAFRAGADREQTFANLRAALAARGDDHTRRLLELPTERVAPFLGIGFGHLQLEGLFEAMSHDNVLATQEIGEDLAAAVAALDDSDPDATRRHLQSAAERLLNGREVVYAVGIHVVDLCLPDEDRPAEGWPAAQEYGMPWNLIACSALLERLCREHPEQLARLREAVGAELAEVCGGPYLERADDLLPLESQLWNLLHGRRVYRELLGQDVRVFARRRFAFHPQLPLLLQNVGIGHALLLAFDESVLPSHRAAVVSWPAQDGKQVESYTRTPHPADSAQTGFHLAHHLHETIMQDQTATLALLHRGKSAAPWYHDWLALSGLASVLGRWTTLSGFFNEVPSGDYTPAAGPDEFHGDHLSERAGAGPSENAEVKPVVAVPHPVSGFVRQVRGRRRLDTAWTLAALLRGLKGQPPDVEGLAFEDWLGCLEDRFEADEEGVPAEELLSAQNRVADALAQRLVARGQPGNPGYLVLNPCGFTRRVALELAGVGAAPPVGGPVKASQLDGGNARVVVEVPGLGFAWVPRGSTAPPPPGRLRLADDRCVRNEFFEAEVDLNTGGLRAFRDLRTRVSRVAQQLVFNPGSSLRVQRVQTTSAGPALGEIVTEGTLMDGQEQMLASFRQRFRAWLGRPMLEMQMELIPARLPEGYPWHAYYAARFAWRDERAVLLRSSGGVASVTSHTRPVTPEFLEVRQGRENAVLLPGGLPFHQRHGGRMLDVILVSPGETAQVFDLGVSLDREYPAQTALGFVSPTPVVSVDRGPPHVGATGWLFHLDAPNLVLTSLRPAAGGADALTARLLECGGHGGPAELRCARDPRRAEIQDARGETVLEAATEGDAVQLEAAGYDLVHLRVEFG
jgi:hypothetical protein